MKRTIFTHRVICTSTWINLWAAHGGIRSRSSCWYRHLSKLSSEGNPILRFHRRHQHWNYFRKTTSLDLHLSSITFVREGLGLLTPKVMDRLIHVYHSGREGGGAKASRNIKISTHWIPSALYASIVIWSVVWIIVDRIRTIQFWSSSQQESESYISLLLMAFSFLLWKFSISLAFTIEVQIEKHGWPYFCWHCRIFRNVCCLPLIVQIPP